MSALNKLQQLRASSKISKKNSTIICIEITPCKNTDTPKKPQQENSHQKSIVSTDSTGNSNKNLQKLCAQQKIAQPEIRQNPHTSSIIKKSVNQSATQINWLVSIRNKLLSKDISKQTEFCFVVSEQALVDDKSINKWEVYCSMYKLFDRCNFCKVCMGSFLDTKIFCFKLINRTRFFETSWYPAACSWCKKRSRFNAMCNKRSSFNAISNSVDTSRLKLGFISYVIWIPDYRKNTFHNFRC